MATTYGYRPDPPLKSGDHPDKSFSLELAPKLTAVSFGDVDLRAYCTETNQYSLNSCAGNATADSVEVLNSIAGLPKVQLSRLFVYTLARNLMDEDFDGKADIDKDTGTYIRLCFDVLASFGICREDLPAGQGGWPYDTTKVWQLPDLKAMRAATAHRIHSAYKIYETGSDRLDKMIEALRANHPIVFGTQVDKGFEDLSSIGPWHRPTQNIQGGHAMVVVGYLAGRGFIVKNSWSRSWGENGFCIMDPDVFTWDQTQDLWVPTKGEAFR